MKTRLRSAPAMSFSFKFSVGGLCGLGLVGSLTALALRGSAPASPCFPLVARFPRAGRREVGADERPDETREWEVDASTY